MHWNLNLRTGFMAAVFAATMLSFGLSGTASRAPEYGKPVLQGHHATDRIPALPGVSTLGRLSNALYRAVLRARNQNDAQKQGD